MAEYKHGEMDISVQEKTFEGFMSMVTKGAIISILLLIFIALVNG
ncbi:MAG TPA: aa3-type cytochrome c oxidase subunit IV [Octadecabacter sp.]|nr:aa3-type cytochrome c oxidase subunit IV [Octadecabacter sp.]